MKKKCKQTCSSLILYKKEIMRLKLKTMHDDQRLEHHYLGKIILKIKLQL